VRKTSGRRNSFVIMGKVEIPVGAIEHNDVEVRILLDEATRSLSSATVVAVIVLIGGWSNVTRQYLGLRRSTGSASKTGWFQSYSCRSP